MEEIELNFIRGDPGKRFDWIAFHNGKLVGLCDGQFCFSCDYSQRKKLIGFQGGRLKVILQPQLKAGPFGTQRTYYLAHLLFVPEAVEVIAREDVGIEGIESEPLFNAVIYRMDGETILVDPGLMALNGDEKAFLKLLGSSSLSAAILTHGHYDHWNFLRVLEGMNVPLYLTPLSYRLIQHTAQLGDDQALLRVLRRARVINPGDTIVVGDATIYTFPLVHTIPETIGLLLSGKKRAVHLGDFKLGEGVEKAEMVTTLRAIAREEIDLLVLNVINAHLVDYTLPESVVLNTITDITLKATGRVILTCFSTNLKRIKGIVEIARAQGRNVFFLGSGMRRAQEELLREGEVVLLEKEGEISNPQSLIFVSGCQAEENSILSRALREMDDSVYRPENSDTIIFSSRGIPGNEDEIRDEIQNLLPKMKEILVNAGEKTRLGLEDPRVKEITSHSTGHEHGDGIRFILEILQPKKILAIPQAGDGYQAFLQMINGKELVKERVIEL